VLTGPQVILALKVAVSAVTLLLLVSLVALAAGRVRLHGRINVAFFLLTATALVGLELVIRVIDPTVFDYIISDDRLRLALERHLYFAVPSTCLMPLMLFTGLRRYRRVHLALAVPFTLLWIGTVVTGLFYLPPTPW
jgi:hypothetical protein